MIQHEDSAKIHDAFAGMVSAFTSLDQLVSLGEDLPELFSAVVTATTEQLPEASAVSISACTREGFVTLCADNPFARNGDDLQRETNSGPCLDALFHDPIYQPTDLSCDRRWPVFGQRISHELGFYSMLSYRLLANLNPTETRGAGGPAMTVASLNIYGRLPHLFGDTAAMTGLLIATHARAAIGASIAQHQNQNLQHALRTSRQISTAVGILMAAQTISQGQAFDMLATTSQDLNRKVRDVAAYVRSTGELPSSHAHIPRLADD